jgi:hypothetical protein
MSNSLASSGNSRAKPMAAMNRAARSLVTICNQVGY